MLCLCLCACGTDVLMATSIGDLACTHSKETGKADSSIVLEEADSVTKTEVGSEVIEKSEVVDVGESESMCVETCCSMCTENAGSEVK